MQYMQYAVLSEAIITVDSALYLMMVLHLFDPIASGNTHDNVDWNVLT